MAGVRRKFNNQDDDEIQAKRRRGPPLVNEVERKLQDIIGRVGDKNSGASIESNLEGLSRVLQEDLDKYRANIIDIIAGCAIYLPNRATVYTTLVGLLNAKNFNFGGDVVEKLIAEQQELLENGKWLEAQNLAIFLCDLGNCRVLTIQSVGEYLESFVGAAFEDNVPQVRTDWFIFTVLRCLPWIGKELAEKSNEQLDNILQGIAKYMEARNKSHVDILQVWRPDGSQHIQEDYLDSLAAQVDVLRKGDWKERHIPRHYVGFDAILQDALQHNLPSFAPFTHTEESVYPFPSVVFRLFDYADCSITDKVLPGSHSIERFLLEVEIAWIIEKNKLNRKNCARELLSFAAENPSVPMGYMIFETIFGQLLRLPNALYPQIFYGALTLELLRLNHEEYPQVLVQAIEMLYNRADHMQPICVDRLVNWFSFHLSNFQYKFAWDDWKGCVEKDSFSGSHVFVRETIEKCRRLGSYEKIVQVLPADFVRVLPTIPEIRYMLDDETEPGHEKAQTFTQMFQERQPAEAFLNELRTDDDEAGYNIEEFGYFITVMLKMASKTYSHNFSALSRYQTTLKSVCDSSEKYQDKLLDVLYNCWKTNQQMMMILIDKLLKMQVLDCGQVFLWIFDGKMKGELDRQWTFEVLNQAVEKLTNQCSILEKDMKELKEKMDKVEENAVKEEEMEEDTKDKDMEELEQIKSKLENLEDFQKSLFIEILQKFIDEMTAMIKEGETEGNDFHRTKYDWIKGRFYEMFLLHGSTIFKFASNVSDLFSDVDQNISECFNSFLALRQ